MPMPEYMKSIYRQREALQEGLRNCNLSIPIDDAIKRLNEANLKIAEYEKKIQESLLWD
jgi:uncharacterized protein YqgV (UPF0045/DUF77 family)